MVIQTTRASALTHQATWDDRAVLLLLGVVGALSVLGVVVSLLFFSVVSTLPMIGVVIALLLHGVVDTLSILGVFVAHVLTRLVLGS